MERGETSGELLRSGEVTQQQLKENPLTAVVMITPNTVQIC
jgi:hypothetical protein